MSSSLPSTKNQAPGTALPGVPASAEPLALAELLAGKLGTKPQAILHVAVNDRTLDMLAQALGFFAPEAEILRFPAWDCMPYDRASPLPALMAERVRTLAALANSPAGKSRIILTTANAAMQKLPPRSAMQHVVFALQKGQALNHDALMHYLSGQGYRRVGRAMEPGEFAVRGGIIDIVPPGMSEGIRIDLFGNDIESVRIYDLLTQITIPSPSGRGWREASGEGGATGDALTPAPLPEGEGIILYPMSEVLLNGESIERFRQNYRDLFGAASKDDPLYEAISRGQHYAGMEHWLPLFYEQVETLFDYCPQALVTLDHETEAASAERQESVLDYYQARLDALKVKNNFGAGLYNPVPPERSFLIGAAWTKALAERECIAFSPFASEANSVAAYKPVLRFTPAEGQTPFDQLKEAAGNAAAKGKATLLACFSQGSRERLQTLLMERGFHCVTVEHWRELFPSPSPLEGDGRGGGGYSKQSLSRIPPPPAPSLKGRGNIYLAVLPLETGFETDRALILSEQDVLGERIVRAARKKKKSDIFLSEAANFAEGELVVHKEHGIGRFEGLVTLTVSGAAHDCLKIIYEGDDKLFIPVENIDVVSRFGLEEEGVKLDKLGGVSWQARKARLKERITIAAEALLKTAAERLIRKAAVIEASGGAYEEFCARFPYAETDDQARAIADVLEDLHSGKPMDRLICGDVGFGKTEVAMRAAFAAIMSGDVEMWRYGDVEKNIGSSHIPASPHFHIQPRLQVAIITPTTLLARQHYRNFKERFAGFPVTLRQLSRMVPTREQKDTREKLARGEVDIVIGTHALLSRQIQFKNLGLLIVDEEQHFGVAQKEKLKEMKAGVHVLTLSATPIPRTLQMALTGVRDLSLITTPPVDRLAIRSFVMPFDPVVVREAVMREMHRGGKCFAVTPRIKDIAELKLKLNEIVPEAKIGVAHGQMAAGDLDRIMNDFYDGEYDILLSTAIIESGLDVPTANTIIIHNAHMFGLSQLYQMRGRVGRGKTRAYAYFLLPHHRLLTKNATRRLEVMQTLDTLGAGFTLASHDMDIRGFGNLVGEEQSGHIREVGIELYQQMLEEAVAQLKVASDYRLQTSDNKASLSSNVCNLLSDWSPAINLGLSVLIPEHYVNDLPLRLGLYRRAASIASEEDISSFAAELIDRFGDMPEETRHFIDVLGIKLLCKKAGIERIDAGPKGAVISFRDNTFAKPEALLAYVTKNPRTLKIRPDQKLVFTHDWKDAKDKIIVIKTLAQIITALL